MALRMRAGSATDVGNVRANNQDDLLVHEGVLFAVADGMGGHASGEVASREVIETLQATYGDDLTVDAFKDAIRWANRAVWRRGLDEPSHAGMGTTLTAVAVVEDDVLAIANIGDSRTYLLRDGTLTQLTADHSFVQEAVRTGQLTREQAESHPRRSQLTRAVGIGDDVSVDIETLVPVRGDRLLLCSDGLWDELPDTAIASILGRLDDPGAAADELVRQAKEAGGRDNVTVVVVHVEEADGTERGLAASTALAAAGDASDEIPEPAGAPPPEPPLESDPAGEEALLRTPHPEEPEPRRRKDRLVTWRVILFTIVLVGVLAVAILAVSSGSNAYELGVSGNNIALFKGDDLRHTYALELNQVDQAERTRLLRGVPVEDSADAQRYVDGLAIRFAPSTFLTVPSTATTASTATVEPAPSPTTATTAPLGP